MKTKVRAIGAMLFVAGLALDAACSISATDPGATSAPMGGSNSGGVGASAGSTSHAGSAGKTGHAGSAPSEAGAGAAVDEPEAGAAGQSGAAGSPAVDPCAACPSGFCLPTTFACVECLPSNDHCPDAKYCGADNTCVSGCKDGTSCASGVCNDAHDCQSCISDQECSAPHVCGDQQCAAACTADQDGGSTGCGTGLTCCSAHCVDTTTDSAHCGACGSACASGQFCGTTGCHDTTLAGLCSIAKVTVVLDGQEGNETPARVISAALAAQCAPPPSVREVSQDVADAVNVKSGRPVAGGDELLIAAGGYFYAHLTDYVTTSPIAPVYTANSTDGLSQEYRLHGTDALLATELNDGSHAAQDYLVIQLVREPTSGSIILNAQGFWQAGTTAAAYYVANAMLPALSTFTKSWYLYQWTDADNDQTPDLNEFTLVNSGP